MNRKQKQAEILRLADKYDAEIRDAFLAAVKNIQDLIVLTEIADALRAGDLSAATSFLRPKDITVALKPFFEKLEEVIVTGGKLEELAAGAQKVEFNFSVTNKPTAEFFQRHKAEWVRYLRADQLQTIEQVIRANVTAGVNPLETAREIKRSIGLTPTQEQYIRNARIQLENLDPAYFGRELRDARFDRTIRRAIKEDKKLAKAQIDKIVDSYRRRTVAKRANDIARTESITMLNAGGDQAWRQAIEAGQVREVDLKRFWIKTNDGKTREAHVSIPILNPDGVGLNQPFRSPLGLIYYPGDPAASPANRINCRCTTFTRVEV